MILRKRVALEGVQLDEIASAIAIQSIDLPPPHETIQAANRMGGFGQRMTSQHWETREVNVTYAIDLPKTQMAERHEIYEAVNKWALQLGWLTVGTLPNWRIYIDKVIIPSAGDMWNWTSKYQITFRAYNVPFWQDRTPTVAKSSVVASGGATLAVPGTAPTPIDVEIRNRSGVAINQIKVSAGGKTIQLKKLNLSGSGTLKISHGTDGLMQITADGASAYSKFTGDDDLIVTPGNRYVSFVAERACEMTASVYGRYI